MRVVQINGGVFGSTGAIMFGIASRLEERGHPCVCFSPVTSTNRRQQPSRAYERIGTYHARRLNVLFNRLTGYLDGFSHVSTWRMIRKIKKFAPDLLSLHNLHGGYLNLPMLFRYIKRNGVPVVWTLHDCWTFTGRCPYFTMADCAQWRTGCLRCPYPKHSYPATYLDRAKTMWKRKKKWFTGVKDMTLVAPSQWLADLVKQSFLNEYPVRVIHNGIDLAVFHPTVSDVRARYRLGDRYVLLGVAFGWDRRKGLDVFIELSRRLGDGYQIVLVGVDERTAKLLPDNVISIRRTNSQRELAELYSAADLFVNPTREDNYPTVNMEALACGTPVVTFDTGGSPEIIDATCGASVPCGDVDALEARIRQIASERPYPPSACVRRAESFDEKARYEEYLELYGETR